MTREEATIKLAQALREVILRRRGTLPPFYDQTLSRNIETQPLQQLGEFYLPLSPFEWITLYQMLFRNEGPIDLPSIGRETVGDLLTLIQEHSSL